MRAEDQTVEDKFHSIDRTGAGSFRKERLTTGIDGKDRRSAFSRDLPNRDLM